MKIYCKTHWIAFFSNLSNALTSRRCQKFLRDCVPQTIAIRGDDRHRCEPIYLSINTFAFKRTPESYIYIYIYNSSIIDIIADVYNCAFLIALYFPSRVRRRFPGDDSGSRYSSVDNRAVSVRLHDFPNLNFVS